jgi:hypothetical protein
MHKISKILNQKKISSSDYKKIKEEWDELTICTQKAKASCFYKQAKKHLSQEKKFWIDSVSSCGREKFNNFLEIIEKEQISTMKEGLVKLKNKRLNKTFF